MTITLGSLFDGSGGFPLAGSLCGIVPIWASEIEPYPIAVTKSRFPCMKHLGDISKVNGAEIEPVDIITFGSPCQDLSVAGKRAGLKHEANGDEKTTRSGLFMEAIRIIKEMRCATNGKYPRFALWENVPGAFSSNKGEDFRIVLEEFIKISEAKATVPPPPKGGWPFADAYVGDGWSLAYRTFDAQYWGVPQRRRRIYLVADFIGGCAPRILFECEGLRGYFEKGESPWQGVASDVESGIGTDDRKRECISFHPTQNPISNDKISHCVSSGNSNCGQASVGVCYPVGVDGYNSALTGELSATLGVNCGISTGRCGVLQPICFAAVASTLRAGAGAPKHNADFVGRLIAQPIAFAQNQRNEVRDLKGKAGALAAEPGMKQQTYIIEKVEVNPTAVYSFDSLGSNSMKSKNPYSGCRQVEVAKTLDTTDPSPNKNQGGIAIVQPWVLFEPRSQDGVPRIHEEISPTLNTAQGGQRQPCVVLPVYCVQGNCIDRSDTAGCIGKGWREGASFILNTIDRPAVVYCMASGQAHAEIYENKCPTLNCTAEHPIITEPMTMQEKDTYSITTGSFMQICKGVSPTLAARDYKGPHLACYWDGSYSTGTITANNTGGNQRMPDKCNFNCVIEKHPVRYIVRRLTPTECARLQGFADGWGVPEHKDDFTDEEFQFWLMVRNNYAVINGKRVKDYTKKQMLSWYNRLHSDSSEYKMWGNGIALPTALYCMQGIADVLYGQR